MVFFPLREVNEAFRQRHDSASNPDVNAHTFEVKVVFVLEVREVMTGWFFAYELKGKCRGALTI